MKVAVVILNYNGAEHLRHFLPSVVQNTVAADVVVADNGSTDESLQLLESEFPSVRIVAFERNYGFAEGYNRALAQLGEYDCFVLLNSDVMTPEGWLEPLVATLVSHSSIAAVGPKILSYKEPDKFEYAGASGGFIDYLGYPFCRGRILSTLEQDRGQYDNMREVFWVSGAAFCVRRSAFEELGGFCGDFFAHMEEIDLCWRMHLKGWRVMVQPLSAVYHLGGGTLAASSPRKTYLNHRNNLAMLYRCASPLQRLVVAVVRPFLDLAAALGYALKGDKEGARAVFKAWRDFIGWHKRLSAERRQIRKNAAPQCRYIYKGSIILRYIFGKKNCENIL